MDRATVRTVATVCLMMLLQPLVAADAGPERILHFNIPRQSADTALTEFAEQADLTLVFPYDEMQGRTANRLVGAYSVQEAVEVLLSGTGLTPTFRDMLTLSIAADEQAEAGGNEMNDRKKTGVLALLGALFGPATASTQALPVEETAQIEEIIVSARRVDESLQTTPIAVTAFTERELAAQSISQLTDISKFAPNLYLGSFGNGSATHASVFLRGQGNQDHVITTDPGVGIYIDGIYVSRTMGANIDLVNIERVEVLRGPQGTLFGKNTLGGAVNIITKTPDGSDAIRVQARAGSRGRADTDFYMQTGLFDSLALSIAGGLKYRDGLGDARLHDFARNDIGRESKKFARTSLVFGNDGPLDVTISADFTAIDQGVAPDSPVFFMPDGETPGFNPNAPNIAAFNNSNTEVDPVSGSTQFTPASLPADPFDSNSGEPDSGQNEGQVWGIGINSTLQLTDTFTARAILSYRDSWYRMTTDPDNSFFDIQYFPEKGGADQGSLEVHFAKTFQRSDHLLGLYYFTEDGNFDADFGGIAGRENSLNLTMRQQTDSLAAFLHSNFDIGRDSRISAGVRWSEDEKDWEVFNTLFAIVGATNVPVLTSDSWDAVTWTLSFDHRFSDSVFSYASLSRGYQSGGFNSRPFFVTQIEPFDPTFGLSREVGLKIDYGNALRLNLAAFFVTYDDLAVDQTVVLPGAGATTFTQNAAESESRGLELEAIWRLGERVSIHGSVGYTDAEITAVEANVTATKQGDRPKFTPEITAALSPRFTIPLKSGASVALRLDYSYQSEFFGQSLNRNANKSPSRSLLDVGLSYEAAGGAWTAGLYGNNVFDERYENVRFDGPLAQNGYSRQFWSTNRSEFGVHFSRSFALQ